MDVAIPIILFLAALLLGIPVAWSMAATGIIGIYLVTQNVDIVLGVLETVPYRQGSNYVLTTVPMFVLLGYLLSHARISDDLFAAMAVWSGKSRGGLATATVYASAMFGAMSGASVAAASVMSSVAIPPMRKHGYSESLAAGTVAVGATLSTLIPPSIFLIVYGVATETSIGDLLLAGLVPGLLLAALVAITIKLWVRFTPEAAPDGEPTTRNEKLGSLKKVLPSLLLIALLIGFLYTGLATPTEVAAVGAFAALLLGLAMRRLNFASIVSALRKTARTTAMIFALLIGATLLGQFLSYARVPTKALNAVGSVGMPAWALLSVVALAYLIGCAFMDELPFMLLTLPVTFPLMISAGFDPVWFGVFSVLLIVIGLIAPPVGLLSFVVSGESGIPLGRVYAGTSIMIVPVFVLVVAVAVWPEIVTWLPERSR